MNRERSLRSPRRRPSQTLWRAAVSALAATAGLGGVTVRPAAALTPNEKFTVAFFEDFMMRSPSNDEMTLWTTYLTSNSRSSMATALLESNEFESLWVVGTRMYYLGEVVVEDPSFPTQVSALQSSDDFVAAEVSTISGSRYFDLHGATNTSFVEAVYEDVLLRPSDPTGLAYWVGRLNTGASTRAEVASEFIRSSAGATRRVAGTAGATSCATTTLSEVEAIPSGSFCIVLDRMADPSGQSYWAGQLAGSAQLPELWADLAGSTEYFNHAQA